MLVNANSFCNSPLGDKFLLWVKLTLLLWTGCLAHLFIHKKKLQQDRNLKSFSGGCFFCLSNMMGSIFMLLFIYLFHIQKHFKQPDVKLN